MKFSGAVRDVAGEEGRLRLPEGEGPDRERESEPYECPAAAP